VLIWKCDALSEVEVSKCRSPAHAKSWFSTCGIFDVLMW